MKIKICNIDENTKNSIKNFCFSNFVKYDDFVNEIEINILNYRCIDLFFEKFGYLKNNIKTNFAIVDHLELINNGKTNNNLNNIMKMYNIPNLKIDQPKVVSIISFGGGIYGEFDNNGIMTNGDCINYWRSIGLTQENMPTVMLRTSNDLLSDFNSTAQNMNLKFFEFPFFYQISNLINKIEVI
jgi:hypothetical protein